MDILVLFKAYRLSEVSLSKVYCVHCAHDGFRTKVTFYSEDIP